MQAILVTYIFRKITFLTEVSMKHAVAITRKLPYLPIHRYERHTKDKDAVSFILLLKILPDNNNDTCNTSGKSEFI